MAPHTTASLASALTRLTGAPPRPGTHVDLYRVTILSSDGKKCSVIIRCSAKKVYKNTLNQIADELRIDRDQVEEVLRTWTHQQLVGHLSQFTAEVLDSPAVERRFVKQQDQPDTSGL